MVMEYLSLTFQVLSLGRTGALGNTYHVNYSLTIDTTENNKEAKNPEHKLGDEYDNGVTSIEDDLILMDSEQEYKEDKDTS